MTHPSPRTESPLVSAYKIESDEDLTDLLEEPRPVKAAETAILLIDDDPDQLTIFDAFLRSKGFKVHTSTTAATALEMMGKTYFDLVICDLKMPDMNGLDFVKAVREIRTFPRASHIPIIMLTSCSGDLELTALNVGADMYCEKKKAKKLLLEQIQFLLSS